MSKTNRKSKRPNYPDDTVGGRLAAEARAPFNSLTDGERAECLAGARALIYGRRPSEQAVGSRR